MNGRRIFVIFTFCTSALVFSLTGCSYTMDFIESAITARSSFSIDAEYNPATHAVDIRWKEGGDSGAFAGFEIYITEQANNEYADYVAAAAGYDLHSTSLPGGLTFHEDTSLRHNYTRSYSHGVNVLAGHGNAYFYRVGVINWDEEDPSKRTPANGYTDPSTDYIAKTNIDKISGYVMVVIP
ncbi:MAG: hypothetical protein BWY96_02499 [Spirochaetes bacterium ADurb.BinA120]|nr:MAG: hypothetical protein BWY96_02499 [Spirochaetes bacterium ADurb.BinA120]